MPHKRNPVLTENLTGLARMVRSAAIPAMENVALWHERDISHSSVERFIGPDATITLDFALARLTGVVDKLLVYPAPDAEESRSHGRARPFAARSARADAGGCKPRGKAMSLSSATR
jgi:adenylosuccinate lyase